MNEPQKHKQPAWWDDAISNSITKLLQNIFLLAPLTLMVLLRKNVGFRLLHPLGLLAAMVLIMTLGGPPLHSPLYVFWSAALLFGIVKAANRSLQSRRGMLKHSYYLGDSILDSLPVPELLLRNRRLAFFFEPVLCFTAGMLILRYCPAAFHALGIWVIISSALLICLEIDAYRRQWKREADIVDGMVVAQFQGTHVERYSEEGQSPIPQRQHTAGIPTGLGADIQKHVRNHKN
jgi:hypothetical protein